MKIKLDDGAFVPTRAHATDAGLDLYSPDDYIIQPHGKAKIDTGVHVELPHNTVGLITSRSGLMNNGLTTRGTIDEPYRGSIGVVLLNHTDKCYTVHRGDRIAQLVILPILRPELELVDKLDDTERGTNGFGSTGK